ncbi:MAG: YihY/virulence factor BrkB family protein [Deltaproteobacteria bacterium]|nr:YihY/virulence factor BrkB family protein [Nannocystaceae bacterium]
MSPSPLHAARDAGITADMRRLATGRFQGVRMIGAALRDHFAGRSEIFAGAVAFFTALSLAPLLVVAVTVVGQVFGEAATRAELLEKMELSFGPQPAALIGELVRQAAIDEGRWWRLGIAILVALWSATSLFTRMQETLNALWGVRPRKGRSFAERARVFLRKRFTAFVLIAIIGALLFASMLLQSVGAGLDAVASELRFGAWPWRIAQAAVAIAAVTLLLTPVYRLLPDAQLSWRDVWPGALLAAVIATAGAGLIGSYLGYTATRSASGAAGGVILLLLWMYFDAHVLLLGARFIRVRVLRHRAIVPEPHAELVPAPKE